MHRHIGGPQSEHPFQALLEARQVVPGQSHDQVGVDVVKAQPLGQLEGFRNVLGGVAAADIAQHLVRQGLRIDTDAADARLPQGQELLPGDGVRAAGLHGELRAAGEIKHLADLPAQGGKLPGGQGGGGAPADVHGDQGEAQVPGHLSGLFQLHQKQVKVRVHQLFRVLHILGDKGAVRAPGGTERDGHIQAEIVFRQGFHRRGLGPQHPPGQLRLGGGDVTVALEVGGARLFPLLLHILAQQFDRVDAREHAPGGAGAGQLHKGVVEQVGHRVLLEGRGVRLPGEGALPVGNRNCIVVCALHPLYAGKGPRPFQEPRLRKGGVPLHLDGAVRKEQAAQVFTFVAVCVAAEK